MIFPFFTLSRAFQVFIHQPRVDTGENTTDIQGAMHIAAYQKEDQIKNEVENSECSVVIIRG